MVFSKITLIRQNRYFYRELVKTLPQPGKLASDAAHDFSVANRLHDHFGSRSSTRWMSQFRIILDLLYVRRTC